VLQQRCCRENEAACLLAAVLATSAVIHDISVIRQCNRSSLLETMIELSVLFNNPNKNSLLFDE